MIFGLVLATLVFLYVGFVRNGQVYDFRKGMIDTIYENNKAAILAMFDTPGMTSARMEAERPQLLAKYAEYEQVGYAEMVLKFWKPLKPEAWYADTSFLK